MSGGSWKYFYSKLEEVAEELERGECLKRRAMGRRLALAARALHDIEWVDSGDYGHGDDAAAIDAFLASATSPLDVAMSDAREAARRLICEIDNIVPPWVCSCGERFGSLGELEEHAGTSGGLLHGDPDPQRGGRGGSI